MKSPALLLLSILPLASSLAEEPAPPSLDPAAVLAAQPGEEVLLPALKSIVLLPAAPAADAPAPTTTRPGVDASRAPWLQSDALEREMAPFLGHPVSLASLDRLQSVIRIHLQLLGRPFARVYAPPQDITDGTVRIVVQLATLDGDVRMDGDKWFSRDSYLGALRVRSGDTLDAATLNADLAWLNRNPYRRVTPVVEAGEQPGTTRVTLRAQERVPLSFTAGYNNTGTEATDEDRLFASVEWGDAFGRGDLLGYRFSSDPAAEHSVSHSVNYTAFLPWRHILTGFGSYSKIESKIAPPFTQEGKSWQLGARYEIPLPNLAPEWTQGVSFSADFKYSDNTLEFATIPITDNATHIVQFGATYTVGGRAGRHGFDFSLDGFVSPGGLSSCNDDDAFNGSRPGATADYAYTRLGARYSLALPADFSWRTQANLQLSEGRLLGSEQLNGAGSSAVRGYNESSAFGDSGVVVSNELHAPPVRPSRLKTVIDPFVFADFASLNDHGGGAAEPRSAGLGANLQALAHLSVSFAYGWQLNDLGDATNSHGHISATLTW